MATIVPYPAGTLPEEAKEDLLSAGRWVSFEEFFEWAPDNRIVEWVNGAIITC